MKFLDEAKIYLESGKGGSGCVAFRREKFIDMGGPDGGNGGRGGHIILECVQNLNTLIDFRYTQHFRAEVGHQGSGSNCSGANGKDLVVKIPGEEKAVWLRLKLIADSGIIGLPNAGKSTFLSKVSRARPKVADYPFTTLAPNLGVIYVHGHEFVMADIPGLIEGAHLGHGLGTRFLGHVERTSVLLHLVDMTQDDIVGAYKTIRKELKAYGGGLAKKPEVIVLNKADALGPELAEDQQKILAKAIRKKVHVISAVSGEGIPNVLNELWKYIDKGRKEEHAAAAAGLPEGGLIFDE